MRKRASHELRVTSRPGSSTFSIELCVECAPRAFQRASRKRRDLRGGRQHRERRQVVAGSWNSFFFRRQQRRTRTNERIQNPVVRFKRPLPDQRMDKLPGEAVRKQIPPMNSILSRQLRRNPVPPRGSFRHPESPGHGWPDPRYRQCNAQCRPCESRFVATGRVTFFASTRMIFSMTVSNRFLTSGDPVLIRLTVFFRYLSKVIK